MTTNMPGRGHEERHHEVVDRSSEALPGSAHGPAADPGAARDDVLTLPEAVGLILRGLSPSAALSASRVCTNWRVAWYDFVLPAAEEFVFLAPAFGETRLCRVLAPHTHRPFHALVWVPPVLNDSASRGGVIQVAMARLMVVRDTVHGLPAYPQPEAWS